MLLLGVLQTPARVMLATVAAGVLLNLPKVVTAVFYRMESA